MKVSEEAPEGQFMIVIRKNQFWKVALRDEAGREYTVEEFRR